LFWHRRPKVREKFAQTDFVRQKAALQASFNAMLVAARGQTAGSNQNLNDLAELTAAGSSIPGRNSTTYGSTACWPPSRSAIPSMTPRFGTPGSESWWWESAICCRAI